MDQQNWAPTGSTGCRLCWRWAFEGCHSVADGLAREVVSFEADPVDAPVDLLGAPTARFYMLPNRPFLQVHAELYDVGPDGEQNLITRGHCATRQAVPGRHVTVRIHLRMIGYRLAAGHHLRLDVSNYDTVYAFPYFEPYFARLFHDNEHASVIEIPVRGKKQESEASSR